MIHELGCPSEIEHVAHEFWTLYMASLTSYQPSNDTPNDHNDESDEGDDNSEQDGVDKHTDTDMEIGSGSDATAAVAQTQLKRPKKLSNPAFEDKTDMSGEEPDDLDNMHEYQRSESSSSESEDDDDNDDDDSGDLDKDLSQNKSKGPVRKRLPAGQLLPVGMFSSDSATELMMPSSIAICYLSAQHLKLPIVMGDFYR